MDAAAIALITAHIARIYWSDRMTRRLRPGQACICLCHARRYDQSVWQPVSLR